MKLLELLPKLQDYTRIRRPCMDFFLVRSEQLDRPLIKCDFNSLQLCEYRLSFYELTADDWEVMK